MSTQHPIERILRRIDGRGYKAYQDLRGAYPLDPFFLSVDHVQGDPFAAPSRFSLLVPHSVAGFPSWMTADRLRRIALGDFLARAFRRSVTEVARSARGSGRSGVIAIDAGGQEVLERNSVVFPPEGIEIRFTVGLPAAGRRILGREAHEMILGELPRIARESLLFSSLEAARVEEHIRTVEDQEALRGRLSETGLVAFVGNGAVLPRRSGVDDRPLAVEAAVPFLSPPELEVELTRPNAGPIRGMGVPAGVHLIVGGGYHGKSTLLRALERSVYNHVPGDGREWVVTVSDAVKIRAEDGRYVERVDISPFIDRLPGGSSAADFSTENASGSTSQAANIVEALEVGTRLLLVDEDTSATNFIIRDARMQALVAKAKEPITPFIDRVRELYERLGVSTVMVMGGSGDYFDVADEVVMMDTYRPLRVTAAAGEVANAYPTRRRPEAERPLEAPRPRVPRAESLDMRRGRREVKVDAKGLHAILFGTTTIDLAALEQLVDAAQARCIAQALIHVARRCAPRGLSIGQGLRVLDGELDRGGLDRLNPYKAGNLARARVQEIAFALNRLRTLKIEHR
jgi:predicted ABC-class ATPase